MRYAVAPFGWLRGAVRARTPGPRSSVSPARKSLKVSRAFMTSRGTGNMGSCMWPAIASRMPPCSARCPANTWNAWSGSKAGVKKGKPFTWSQCVWLKRMSASLTPSRCRILPSARTPVPASRMRIRPATRTSTQLVLPPKPTYAGEGQAMLPRTPQNRTVNAGVSPMRSNHRPIGGESDVMHVPDGFLSAGVAGATWTAGAATLGWALRAERRSPERVPAGTLGALSGFVFAAQLVNVPLLPGTSGHLVGAMLATALVGPWRGLVVMAVVLAVQALLFQDGGVTAYGANLLAMGGGGGLGGCAVASLVDRLVPGARGRVAGPVAGAFVGTLVGAALIATALAASGLYPAATVLPLMLSLHVPIALLEAALTGAILGTVLRWRPDLARGLQTASRTSARPPPVLGALVVALAVAAFVAPFASPLPDGLETLAARLGFANAARALWPAPAPDYALPWVALGRLGTALAGVLGTVAAAALAWGLSRGLGPREAGHQ